MSFFRRASAKKAKGSISKSSAVPKIKTPSPSSNSGVTVELPPSVNGNAGRGLGFQATSPNDTGLLLIQDDYHPGDLGVSHSPNDAFEKYSRLIPSLQNVVKDHDAIPYLIQYLEACGGSWLIRFWLDAESFQASTWTRIRTHSLQSLGKSSVIEDHERTGMKRSVSINQDITSPDSLKSGNTDRDKSSSDVSELSDRNLSLDEDQSMSQDGLKAANDFSSSDSKTACDNEDESKGAPICTDVTSCTENAGCPAPANPIGDSRNREKCKSELAKGALSLPLSTSSTDNQAMASHTESSAISYRDITTPSPTSQEGSIKKPQKSSGYGPVSKESLAEKLKKSVEQDAVRIFTKYLAQEATHPIGISDDLRNNTIRKICREDGQVDPECFVECQTFALEKIQDQYYAGFLSCTSLYKYQVDLLTNGKIHLMDVLYNDTAMFYFMEYMEQEGLSNLLQFVIAVDNFEKTLASQDTYDGTQAQADAMVLYDKYFSLQAAQPVGFPDSIRFEIEGNICREEGPLPECFARPRHIVLHTIEKLHFQRYLASDMFYKYLSELVSMVQSSQDYPLEHKRKRRGSETSSEHSVGSHSIGSESISSKNTLLASGSTHRPTHRVQLNKLEENMKDLTIDPALLNPDTLWERPMTGKMTLGKIDSLGQFVSDFAPDPEISSTVKKKNSTSSRFFKSKKDKEREEEEMARKVADMILKDVASVTQAISAIKNPGQKDPKS